MKTDRSKSKLHPAGSVYTVRHDASDVSNGWREKVTLGRQDEVPNEQVFQQAVIEFKDDGAFVDAAQLEAATRCIRDARSSKKNPNGPLVVVFIHGWHHNAEWKPDTGTGDDHFSAFREVLMSLSLREAERYRSQAAGRRVIGIYLGWNGDPPDSWLTKLSIVTHLSFYDRMKTVRKIAEAGGVVKAVQEIVLATKGRLRNGVDESLEAPLIMIGHSMGALMLESAFLELLMGKDNPLVQDAPGWPGDCAQIKQGGNRVHFPDVLLAVNSAADSVIARNILDELKRKQFAKTVNAGAVGYSAPLLVSVTSEADTATKIWWRLFNSPLHKTDGHDASLFTHQFTLDKEMVPCPAKPAMVDFGQDWHALRKPVPPAVPTPEIAIDLPARKRKGLADQPPHARYKLAPLRSGTSTPHLAWFFQVPKELSSGHNDIFNYRMRLLIMALVQISGAVMSLAEDFNGNFE